MNIELQKNKPVHQPNDEEFNGFRNSSYTPIPDEFFDKIAVQLSEAELRVLLYLMRRTLGFRKRLDAISLSQLANGICRRDGTILDRGTGLSKPAILKAITGLVNKNIITVERNCGVNGRNEINTYELRFIDEREAVKTIPATIEDVNSYSSSEYSEVYYSYNDLAKSQNLSSSSEFKPTLLTEKQNTGDKLAAIKSTPRKNSISLSGKPVIRPLVNLNNQGSKPKATLVVNQHDQQHGRIQNNIKQLNNKQLLCSDGSLALESLEVEQNLESVEVEIDGDQLYINFRKLVLALVELGLAEKLAVEYAYKYPEEYLWEKIEITQKVSNPANHQPTLRNTAGYLRRAIEENYQPLQLQAKSRKYNHSQITAASDSHSFKARQVEPEKTLLRGAFSRAATPSAQPSEFIADAAAGVVGLSSSPDCAASSVEAFQLNPAVIWQQTMQDLESRFRLDAATLELLVDSFLEIGENHKVTIWLAYSWQERLLNLAVRNQIRLALRQQLEFNCNLVFGTIDT